MGEYIDKAKGAANQAIGKTKIALGRATDSADLVIDGAGQEAKGKAQTISGQIKGLVGDAVSEAEAEAKAAEHAEHAGHVDHDHKH